MKAYLYREQKRDCMIGGLQFDTGFQCLTLELPWRNNEPELSCIPEGVYKCAVRKSRKWSPVDGLLYELTPVQGRTDILIHAGNTIADSLGCILVGSGYSERSDGPTFLANSRKTLIALHEHTKNQSFTLRIGAK
jgi:hypothetical protein